MNPQVKRRKKLSATDARNLRTLLLLNVFAPEEIGARIAQARIEAGLTQEELAALIGVSTRSLQGYEAGAVKPYRHIERIAEALDRPVSWFLHGDQPEPDQSEVSRLADEVAAMRRLVERLLELADRDDEEPPQAVST